MRRGAAEGAAAEAYRRRRPTCSRPDSPHRATHQQSPSVVCLATSAAVMPLGWAGGEPTAAAPVISSTASAGAGAGARPTGAGTGAAAASTSRAACRHWLGWGGLGLGRWGARRYRSVRRRPEARPGGGAQPAGQRPGARCTAGTYLRRQQQRQEAGAKGEGTRHHAD